MFYHTKTKTYHQETPITGFTVDGNQYPSNWFQISTPEQKVAAGFVEVIESGTRENDKYFYVTEQLTDNIRYIINTPKPAETIDGIVKLEIAESLAKVRKVRSDILDRLVGIAFAAQISGDINLVNSILDARRALLDITEDLPTTLQGVTDTIAQRYTALVIEAITASPALETAFNSMDL